MHRVRTHATRAGMTLFAALAVVPLLAACNPGVRGEGSSASTPPSSLPTESVYAPQIIPSSFVGVVDNPYWPLARGSKWVYEGETDEGLERVEVVVLDETRQVMGVECIVVRDTVTIDGELAEDTRDWYAQDADGNVWYFGEAVVNYEGDKVVDTSGSWEAGVDGALPGIVMWAKPQPGDPYRQEYYLGQAEDMAQITSVTGGAQVPAGAFADVVVTEEWTLLEPNVKERKTYARDVGLVLEEVISGGEGRIALIEYALP